MAFFDKSVDQLEQYRPEVAEPADFDDFWRQTIAEARQHDLKVRLEQVDNHLVNVDSYDVTFAGFGGHDVKAWLMVPVDADQPLPGIVTYVGYSGGRGMPLHTLWPAAGFAQLHMDTRGEGWSDFTSFETTPDPGATPSGVPGVMTMGITDPQTYFYRRLFTDCFRAIEAALTLEQINSEALFVHGGSQGGGMAIAAAGLAGLHDIALLGAVPDVPFLCHFEKAIGMTDAYPYKEVSDFLKARPHLTEVCTETLSYHDGVNFAKRATCPTLFSVGLMDMVCPPSTVYAAFNHWGHTDREIKVYPHNGHEGGRELHTFDSLGWVRDRLQPPKRGNGKRPRRGL